MKAVGKLKSQNNKLEKEIVSARHAVDNWKEGVKNMSDQILNDVNKDIISKVEKLVKVKDNIKNANKTYLSRWTIKAGYVFLMK